MILRQGLASSGIAAGVGLCLALALSGTISGLISLVNPRDPVVYLGVFLLMLCVTGAACYVPARTASMVDPNVTLRN
jgi:ABC-type antimicrobial peptide transport system permease subunit